MKNQGSSMIELPGRSVPLKLPAEKTGIAPKLLGLWAISMLRGGDYPRGI